MKNILITDTMHTRVKLEATRLGMTIQDWTARVLEAALDEAAARRLVDTRAEYATKGENDG